MPKTPAVRVSRRTSKALLVLAVVALLAACGSSSAAPKEEPGVFITRILREEINGQWSAQWAELHPAHQKLISRAEYVACSRAMQTDIANGREVFHVLSVQDDPIDVAHIPQKTSKIVTISFRNLTYRLHAVDVNGKWKWILGGRFLTQVEKGRCLDGSPLTH